MQGIAGLLMALFGNRADRFRKHAGAQMAFAVALAMCAVAASVYGLAFLTVLLAARVGLLWAFATGFGVFTLSALIAGLLMQMESRRHARLRQEEAARDRNMVLQAALAALGGAGGRKSALVVALAALAVGLASAFGKGNADPGDGKP